MGQSAIAPSLVPVPGAVDDPLVEIIGHLGAVIMQIEKNHDPFIFARITAAHELALWMLRHPTEAGGNHAPWTPSIVPSGANDTVYLVVDCYRDGCVWREAEVQQTDLETVIADLMSGQYSDPLRVVAFNTAERWAGDVSQDIAHELRRRADLAYEAYRRLLKPSSRCTPGATNNFP